MADHTQKAKQAGKEASDTAQKVANHPWFEKVARAGFVVSGLVHAMIGWICLRMATSSGGSESADQSGALREFAQAPLGGPLLIVGAIAMFALALYNIADIFFGPASQEEGKEKLVEIAKSAGKAVVHAALGFTAMKFGLGGGSSSGDSAQSTTASFIGNPAGKALIIAVGVGVVAAGVFHVYKGISQKFKEDLKPASSDTARKAVEVTGIVGFCAKGIALAGIGVMLAWAALSSDSERARGMDAAFKGILALPAGPYILGAVGVGFILFGVFSVLKAKYQKM